MHAKSPKSIEERVARAAEATLSQEHWVSAIDVMTHMGWLAPSHVKDWRFGRASCLENFIQCSPGKIAHCLDTIAEWARSRGLEPKEATYVAPTRDGQTHLRFSKSGDPALEQRYRTHYVLAALSPAAAERLQKKLTQAPELVVFSIVGDSRCSECGAELISGDFLFMERDRPLCLACADLDELVYLPRGDATLTRRARKYSPLSAVVVRFSRSRGRYERQGILVAEDAIDKAESECLADAELRARQRERAALRAVQQDETLAESMTAKILELFPGCPPQEARAIAHHTTVRGSGRVGRSAEGRALDDNSVALAVMAHIRHRHTAYDRLLMQGHDRTVARDQVRRMAADILDSWRK